MDNKMSVLSCTQNALDDFPSARLSLARLCPHRALFGVWGWPQGALMAKHTCNGNRKFTIFAIQLLPKIKTVADPTRPPERLMIYLPFSSRGGEGENKDLDDQTCRVDRLLSIDRNKNVFSYAQCNTEFLTPQAKPDGVELR